MNFSSLQNPPRLKPGATIGVVAPSAGNAERFPHRVVTAERMLTRLGYKVKFAKHALERHGYVSASAEDRAADIHEMFLDDEVQAILCTIGGDHSNQLLKHLDFNLIKSHPKIFVGFSDVSVLHYAFAAKANLRTFYGPCVMTQFGEYPELLPYTLASFQKALTSVEPLGNILPSDTWTSEMLDWTQKKDLERPRHLQPSSGYDWLRHGSVSGPIVGGCIPSINHLTGTDYWIDPAQTVFFLDIPEGHEFGQGLSIQEVDSYLADLDNLGVFASIKGLIVGRPYNYSSVDLQEFRKLIESYTRPYSYPVLLNVNIGHADPIITLPLGVEVELDSSHSIFSILTSGVRE